VTHAYTSPSLFDAGRDPFGPAHRENLVISDLLAAFVNWAKDVLEAVGYPGLAFLITLENVFPPIPSEAVLPMAGFLSGEGKMNVFLAILAATTGSVVGALILYWVGHWFGEDRVR